jgi:hypothetical protein
MTTTEVAQAEQAPLAIDRTLAETWRALCANPALIGLSVTALALPNLAVSLLGESVAAETLRTGIDASSTGLWVAAFVGFAMYCIVCGALLRGIFDHLTEAAPRPSIGSALQAGFDNAFALAPLVLLYMFATVCGAVLLLLPGLLVLAGWSLATSLMVIEQMGLRRAIHRSVDLTRNRLGGVLVVKLVAVGAIWLVTRYGPDLVPQDMGMTAGVAVGWLFLALVQAALQVAAIVVVAVMYWELIGRPYVNAPGLAEVFD